MKVAVLGAGAYGISLSSIFNKNNHDVTLWTYSEEECKALKDKRESEKLKGYKIPKTIKITTSMKTAAQNKDVIVLAVPAHSLNEVCKNLKKEINIKNTHILLGTKGIENESCDFLTEIVKRHIKTKKIAVISGPTFATDIIKNAHIGFSLGVTNVETKNIIKKLMENDNVKLRDTKDIIGVQICGAIKNVMAIYAGILEGMKSSHSTKALFLTEALNDIKNLLKALGGNQKTILSFSGFGDIIMTCTSIESRNFTYGKLIGEGKLKEALKYSQKTTVEGLYTLESLKQLIRKKHIKMEIIDLINDILYNGKEKEELLNFLIKKK